MDHFKVACVLRVKFFFCKLTLSLLSDEVNSKELCGGDMKDLMDCICWFGEDISIFFYFSKGKNHDSQCLRGKIHEMQERETV